MCLTSLTYLSSSFLHWGSRCIDYWYDLKYYLIETSTYLGLWWPAREQQSSKVLRRARDVDAEELELNGMTLYQWSDGLYYITADTQAPYYEDDQDRNQDEDQDRDREPVPEQHHNGQAMLFFGNVHAYADERQLKIIAMTAGPGQDYSISVMPKIDQFRTLLDCPSLTKVIFTNELYEEFISE